MREGERQRAAESEKDVTGKEKEKCTARYCLDVDAAPADLPSLSLSFSLPLFFSLPVSMNSLFSMN